MRRPATGGQTLCHDDPRRVRRRVADGRGARRVCRVSRRRRTSSARGSTKRQDEQDARAVVHLRAIGTRRVQQARLRDDDHPRYRSRPPGLGTGTVWPRDRVQGRTAHVDHARFRQEGRRAWSDILRSNSSDTGRSWTHLSWLNINALDQFPDEFRSNSRGCDSHRPDTAGPGVVVHPHGCVEMKTLLSDGVKSGEIQLNSPSAELLARCVTSSANSGFCRTFSRQWDLARR